MTFDLILEGMQACILASLYPYFFLIHFKNFKVVITIVLILIAVLIESRTLFLITLMVYFYLNDKKIKIKVIYKIAFFFLLIALLTNINSDSVFGRLFIWRNILANFFEIPFFGFGPDTFKIKYANWQISYFESHKEYSLFHKLADSPSFAFNEVLHFYIEYGVFSIFIFLLLLIYNTRNALFEKNYLLRICSLSNLIIITISMFSYTLHSIWVLLILIFNHFVILLNKYGLSYHIVFRISIVLTIFFCITFYYQKREVNNMWKYLKTLPINASNEKEKIYIDLFKDLSQDQYFLHDYCKFLLDEKKHAINLSIIHSSKKYFNQFERNLLLGNVHMQLLNYDSAYLYFMKAHLIIPSRFIPVYNLMTVSFQLGDTILAKMYALQIVNMPVKIDNPISFQIKKEAAILIEKF